jgi:hypothetical protein
MPDLNHLLLKIYYLNKYELALRTTCTRTTNNHKLRGNQRHLSHRHHEPKTNSQH